MRLLSLDFLAPFFRALYWIQLWIHPQSFQKLVLLVTNLPFPLPSIPCVNDTIITKKLKVFIISSWIVTVIVHIHLKISDHIMILTSLVTNISNHSWLCILQYMYFNLYFAHVIYENLIENLTLIIKLSCHHTSSDYSNK